MCERSTSSTDRTADLVLSDLLSATEDLIDFAINVLDTIRLQTHFNERNRRSHLGSQLQQVAESGQVNTQSVQAPKRSCTVAMTLKYDLSLYLNRILQACKRTKANLLLLRVSRTRANNTTLLLVASTPVRVNQLNRKVQLLTRLVKDNGGEFPKRTKKTKKQPLSKTEITNEDIEKPVQSKPTVHLMSKEDLADYVEITLSFRLLINKYRDFITTVQGATRSTIHASSQDTLANAIVLIPIASNAIDELNNILNRLTGIAFKVESESNQLRQPPAAVTTTETQDLYRAGTVSPMPSAEKIGLAQKAGFIHSHGSTTSFKGKSLPLLKTHENRTKIRNQSALTSSSNMSTMLFDNNQFKLTPNIIADIFEDFFLDTNEFLNDE